MRMKISIAMASFNGSRYLSEQLESFALQSRMPDELIVTDDCSHDGTADILLAFAAKVPFTTHISVNPHNLGYAQNFGAALTRTTGDLVFLSDPPKCPAYQRKMGIIILSQQYCNRF